jgi:hypothetical protein
MKIFAKLFDCVDGYLESGVLDSNHVLARTHILKNQIPFEYYKHEHTDHNIKRG